MFSRFDGCHRFDRVSLAFYLKLELMLMHSEIYLNMLMFTTSQDVLEKYAFDLA